MEREAEISAGRRVRSPADPISAYNHFVSCYNVNYHLVGSRHMHLLPSNCLYHVGYRYLRMCYSVPLFVSALAPFLNVLVLLLTALLWLLYELAYRIHTKNILITDNHPFKHMIYSPAICAKFTANNTFLPVARNLCPETFNLDSRLRQDGSVTVMFYNAAFRRYYEGFVKARWVHLGYLMLVMGCCAVSLAFLYPLCGLDVLNTRNSIGLMS